MLNEDGKQLVGYKVLYEAEGYPVFQNRSYDSINEVVNCPKDDIKLVEDLCDEFKLSGRNYRNGRKYIQLCEY